MVLVFVSHTIEYYHSSISATFSVIKIVIYLKIKKARTRRAFILSAKNKLLLKVINYIRTGDSVCVIRTFSRISVMPK